MGASLVTRRRGSGRGARAAALGRVGALEKEGKGGVGLDGDWRGSREVEG